MVQKITFDFSPFVLTYEDYQEIKIPPVKNFGYKEKELGVTDGKDSDDGDIVVTEEKLREKHTNRRNIIVAIILLLVAGLIVLGIYFIIIMGN